VSIREFFSAETSARPLGVARAVVGFVVLLRAAIQYHLLGLLMSGYIVRAKQFPWMPDLPAGWVPAFIAAWMLLAVCFAVGYHSRLSGGLLVAMFAYQLALDENLQWSNSYFMMWIILLLTVADSGCSFSLDRRLRRKDPQQVARWSTLLPRLQLSIVYFYSWIFKLNPHFLAGESIERATRLPGFLHGTWLPSAVAALTAGIECFVSFGLWVPSLRRAAFVLGMSLHTAIFFSMDRAHTATMFTFGLNILAPYLLFLEQAPGSRLIIWDDDCSFCRRWIAFFRAFDWLAIHRFEGSSKQDVLRQAGVTPQEADLELKVAFEGRTLGGFDAVREVLCVLPISFLWAPLLAIPPIPSIGRRLYRRVAARRNCTVSGAVNAPLQAKR